MGNTVPIPSVCAMEGGDMATAAVTSVTQNTKPLQRNSTVRKIWMVLFDPTLNKHHHSFFKTSESSHRDGNPLSPTNGRSGPPHARSPLRPPQETVLQKDTHNIVLIDPVKYLC